MSPAIHRLSSSTISMQSCIITTLDFTLYLVLNTRLDYILFGIKPSDYIVSAPPESQFRQSHLAVYPPLHLVFPTSEGSNANKSPGSLLSGNKLNSAVYDDDGDGDAAE
jgi:hypothetical protein